jgi:hypothetical protein
MIATYFYSDIFGIEFSIWKYYSVEALKFIDTEICARATKSKFREKAFPLNHGRWNTLAATRTFKRLHTKLHHSLLSIPDTSSTEDSYKYAPRSSDIPASAMATTTEAASPIGIANVSATRNPTDHEQPRTTHMLINHVHSFPTRGIYPENNSILPRGLGG